MFTLPSPGGIRVHVHTWAPDGPPRAVVQIAHGMGEYGGRYARLAEALTADGCAVYAGDHRGHGLTMHAGKGRLGEDGWNELVADLARITAVVERRHPGVPVVLLGHSLGSFAAQQYALDHGARLAGLALFGTTALDHLARAGTGIGPQLLAAFNQPFQPARTPADWLSRDPAAIDAYLADPLCGFSLDTAGFHALAAAAPRLADPSWVRPDLPVAVFAGEADPITAGLAPADLVARRYRDAGLDDVTHHSYPGARHELLHETNRDEVTADLLVWLKRVTA
ncbi:alpha/beta fold hydrolase [Kitasatospora sp. NPDC101183]|uniref:alpha/beta fold hydrolase n=1 Tax=Kitasatospora sp. NPDC101183 TaxID=3364100 RepID=UPI00380940F0